VRQLVAVQHPGGLLAAHPGAPVGPAVAAVQDLQQRPPHELGMLVRLHEPARTDAGAELGLAGMAHGLDRGVVHRAVLDVGVGSTDRQQTQEVRLAGAVAAEHRDPLAVPDLEVERLHQAGELEVLADHGALARAATRQPHLDLLLARLLGGRTGLLELPEAGLRGLVLRGHSVVVLGLDLEPEDERLDLRVLLVPATAHLLQARKPVTPRLVVRREAAGVGPHEVASGAQLDGDHAGGGVGQQLAVVADEQDRLVGLLDPALEPDLAGNVEEVVGLVEQQHLVGPGEEVLQHQPLLLAAGEGAQLAVLGPVVGHTEALDGADVPGDLEVVSARLGVLGQRVGVGELGPLVVGLHQRPLVPVDLGRGRADPLRAHRQQQVGDCGFVAEPGADHLPHHAEATGPGDRPGVRRELAGDDLQQRGLAGTVGAHQRHLGALTDPERHVVEQHPPVGQLEPHPGDVHVSHERRFSGTTRRGASRLWVTPRVAGRSSGFEARCARTSTTDGG
jgi:hypothetical protein